MAKQVYDRLKKDNSFLRLTDRILTKLKKIKRPEARARAVYKEIDLSIEKLFRQDVVRKSVSCQAGCAACCHSLVGVTAEEATLLAKKIQHKEVAVDLSLLAFQASVIDNPHAWYRLPFAQRACPFLDRNNNQCKIYADRPSVCRTNFAIGNPELCAGDKGEMRLLKTDEASMILIGAYMATEESGELQKMVWKRLSKKSKQSQSILHKPSEYNGVFKI